MAGVIVRCSSRDSAISARPVRTADPWRSMSSDEGGVGIVSSSVGRARSARGRLPAAAVVARFGFRAGVLGAGFGAAFLGGAALLAFERLRGFVAARLSWRLAAGRLLAGRVGAVFRREPLDRAPRAPSRLAMFPSFRTLT